jgi:hypothetical protein
MAGRPGSSGEVGCTPSAPSWSTGSSTGNGGETPGPNQASLNSNSGGSRHRPVRACLRGCTNCAGTPPPASGPCAAASAEGDMRRAPAPGAGTAAVMTAAPASADVLVNYDGGTGELHAEISGRGSGKWLPQVTQIQADMQKPCPFGSNKNHCPERAGLQLPRRCVRSLANRRWGRATSRWAGAPPGGPGGRTAWSPRTATRSGCPRADGVRGRAPPAWCA